MQYVLTEEEYNELKGKQPEKVEDNLAHEIQAFFGYATVSMSNSVSNPLAQEQMVHISISANKVPSGLREIIERRVNR